MQGLDFMIKRAEYRKLKEAPLFERVMEWAREDGEEIIEEIGKVSGERANSWSQHQIRHSYHLPLIFWFFPFSLC